MPKKGNIPWNKGLKGAQIAWNKGKKFPEYQNENNGFWKGDKVGYSGIHRWVYRHWGKAEKCEYCGCEEEGKVIWANISGKYLRKRIDWLQLCFKCHWHFDRKRIYNNKYYDTDTSRASRQRIVS